ncbi:UNVERIFIED_CONTAM: hypothetical protein ABID48_005179 [Paenibacillus phyllosphaerae]
MIRSGTDSRSSNHTASSVKSEWPDSLIVRLDQEDADALNRILCTSGEPFFIVLGAGDTVLPGFRAALKQSLQQLEPSDAGFIAQKESVNGVQADRLLPPLPLVWRTEAVLNRDDGGFQTMTQLPFPSYIFHERMLQLKRSWNWPVLKGLPLYQAAQRTPSWMQLDREWALLAPILAGERQAVAQEREPVISVVLCMYNASDYMLWAVRSVLIQTYPDWELILVDDGSNDATDMVLKSNPLLQDTRIRMLSHPSNLGKAAALNTALACARGRWLLELDADDWLCVDALETLARGALANPEAGAIYADQIEWLERHNKQLVLRGIARACDTPTIHHLLDRPVPLAPRMYRTALLRKLGGWLTDDPYGGRLYEDIQMLVRVMELRQLYRIPMGLYHRRLRAASVSQQNKERYGIWKRWMTAKLSIRD